MRIGMVGLGLLGRAIAGRLREAGHEPTGYDLEPSACALARKCGVNVLRDAQAVVRDCDLLLLSLLTSENRRALMWGEQGMASALPPGMIVLDTTTARPADLREDSARLAEQGVRLIDVCVSGSSQAASEGRTLALVGDTEEGAGAYRFLLAAFSKAQFFLGAPGRGNEAKLIVNLVYGLHRAVLAEALGLAEHAGFPLATMLDILKAGDTYSAVMDTKGGMMVSGCFEPPVARLAQHAKDVGLIAEFAQQSGARIPLEEINLRLLRALVDAGYGDLDNAAIFKAYQG